MQKAAVRRKTWSLVSLLASLAMIGVLLGVSGCGGSSAPIGVSVNASATTVDGADSVTLTATVANDKKSAGVTWTVAGGGTLSNQTTSSATYTAPAASTSALTVTVTATSVTDVTKNFATTITVPAAPSITSSTLAAAAVGTAYSAPLAASGGISPYTWSLSSGTLPASMSLSSAGVLSGTPMAADAGTYNLTFKVIDSGKATPLTASKALSLTINPAPTIAFTTTSLATATYKTAYSATVAATGGAGTLTYNLASGPLPAGLTLSPAGLISGTPTATGTFPISVSASDAYGDTQTQSLSLKVVYPALTVTTASLPTAYVGSNYSQTVSATGGSGAGYVWTVSTGSTLPAGLTLSTAGVLSGKPTTAGAPGFSVTVTDSASNTGSASYTLTINPAVSVTTGTTLPTGYVGSSYSQQLAATGGSGTGYTWAVASGSALPAGLTLSTTGLLSGKPTATGTPSFGVTVTDSVGNTTTVTFTVTVSAGVSINSITLPGGYQGTAYPGATFTATGGTGTGYTWTWAAASGSTLPAGISLSTGGVVSGTPTAAGTFSIVVTATDSASNTASTTVSLTVQAKLSITSATLASGTVNVAYSQTLAATGGTGTGYTWSVDSAGAASLATLNLSVAGTGVISGTPTTTGTATFNATVTDSASHTATATLTISVYSVLTVTTSTLPATDAGVAYSQTLGAGGGSGTGYTWTVTAGATSLTAENLTVSSAGAITGTPSAAGTATFTVQVKDSAGNTATANLSIQVFAALTLTAPSSGVPGPGTTGGVYNAAIAATGGSGTYAWTITGLPADGLSASPVGGAVTISGTPTAAATVSFTAAVKDTVTNQSVGPDTYTVVVSNPAPLTLPPANPSSLPAGTVNQAYGGSITASGGAGPYTWAINGTPVTGGLLALSNGLSASSTGGNVLLVTGTPTTTTAVPLTSVTVKDNTGTTAGPITYSVSVNAAGSQVSGQITLNSNCGGSGSVPPITVRISTSPVQTATTDTNGNYSFPSVPNGTYTITPSITGPSSVFFPATQSVTVNNGVATGENFTASLGYTVSGTVSYGGTNKGQVYLTLQNSNCSGSSEGTSITESALTSGGAFTIRGVPPGNFGVFAGMDILGEGGTNAADPSSGTATGAVSNANVTGVSLTLADPTLAAPTAPPGLHAFSPVDQGVIINFKPIVNSNGVEQVTSYTVEWSTSSSFSSPGTATFKAIGNKTDIWILNNSTTGISGTFSNGTPYYFRARGNVAAGSGPWAVWGGGTPVAVTPGAPSGAGYFTVTGAVTLPSGITPTGPLYVGFFDLNLGTAYGMQIASPSNSSSNAYTVQVPSGSSYYFFGILDQNKDGLVDVGDVSNTGGGNGSNTMAITGNMTGQNLTLPSTNSTATVTTQNMSFTSAGGTSTSYNVNLNVRAANKLPVAVTVTSGPNVINPIDIGACTQCGNVQFYYNANVNSIQPKVGDAYSFLVTYSDGSSETVTGSVTGVVTAFATGLTPSGSVPGDTTPTFTWTDPASASSYTYQFYLSDNNGNTIWQIPGNNSSSNGFSSSFTSITWGTDPTGSNNSPSVGSLTTGTTYNWQISVQDANGNQASTVMYFIP